MIQRLLALYVLSLPFEYLFVRLYGSDTVLKPYRLIAIGMVGLWLLHRLGSRREFRLDSYDWIFSFFLASGLALAGIWSVLGNANLNMAVSDTVLGAFALLTYLVIKNSDSDARRYERLLDLYLYSVCASIVLNIAMGMPTTGERFEAFSESSNRLAFSITVAVHVLIAKILSGRRTTVRGTYLARGGIILGLVVALLFTGSRGAIVALIFTLPLHAVALAATRGRQRRRIGRLAALAPLLLIGGLAVSVTLERYGDEASGLRRLDRTGIEATAGRYDIGRAVWQASLDHFFLGMGTAQYRAQHRTYVGGLEHVYEKRMTEVDVGTHADVLELLTSSGIIAAALYVWLLVSLFLRLRARARMTDQTGWLYQSLLPICGLIAISGLSHVFIRSPHFFFLMAVMTASVRAARVPRRQAAPAPWAKHITAAEIAQRVPRPSRSHG